MLNGTFAKKRLIPYKTQIETDAKSGQRLENIQAMRGIAALTVVLVHIGFIGVGKFGVDLFFCISGFIMVYITEKSSENFLAKRVIRIVPLYWMATIAMLVLSLVFRNFIKYNFENYTFSHFVKSFLFIPYYHLDIKTNTMVSYPVVIQGWTLILELFFYVVFWLSIKINRKYRALISTVILAVIVFIGLIAGKTDITFIKYYGSPIILEFSLGMLAYYLLFKNSFIKKIQISGKYIFPVFVFIVYAIWGALFVVNIFNLSVDRFVIYGLPCFLFFMLFFKLFEIRKPPRILVFLGNISYSIYLVHIFIILFFNKLFVNLEEYSKLGLILIIFMLLPVIIGISWVSWYIVENKFTEFLRKKLKV